MSRCEKDKYYLQIAKEVSSRGTCIRRNFGSIIVKNDVIVSTGYTGAPRGRKNCCDIGVCARREQNIPRGERYELCVSGDTKILLHGNPIKNYTLETMFTDEYHRTFTVGSCFKDCMVFAHVEKPMLVGERPGVRVLFGDDTFFDCTPDHGVMLVSGEFIEAAKLRPHDTIMGYRLHEDGTCSMTSEKRVVSVTELEKPIMCFDLCVPPTENFAIDLGNGTGVFVHNCRSVHSEMNAIINGNRADMIDSTLYLYGTEVDTGKPVENACCCSMCKRAVINAGIKEVVTLNTDGTTTHHDVSDWIDNDESLDLNKGY